MSTISLNPLPGSEEQFRLHLVPWQQTAAERALETLPGRMRAVVRQHRTRNFSLKTPPSKCGVYLLTTQMGVGFAYYSSILRGWSVSNMNFRVFMRSGPRPAVVRPTNAMLNHWTWCGLDCDITNLI